MYLPKTRNCILIKNIHELKDAKQNYMCRHILYEDTCNIYIWDRVNRGWTERVYTMNGRQKPTDVETTGLKAYYEYFKYCGKDNVEKMKHILPPIPIWESHEQIHYYNIEHVGEKIYKNIYEYDANSAFTYGVMELCVGFEKLKEYMNVLYDKKEHASTPIERSKYKNLQNYLIGYFARLKDMISTRSNIIFNSNMNIRNKIAEINKNKGTVYLSSTDSIVTDDIGNDVMQKYIGTGLGQFKLKDKTYRLCYLSSNRYQIGDRLVYSGVKYFARQHTNLFDDTIAIQNGSLLKGCDYEYNVDIQDDVYTKICSVKFNEIVVTIYNKIFEIVDIITYKFSGGVKNGKHDT